MNVKNGLKKGVLFSPLMAGLVVNATAEEMKGIIRGVEIVPIGDGGRHLTLNVDTIGNRIANAFLLFLPPLIDSVSGNIRDFVENEMEVVFDDDRENSCSQWESNY